jgi:hypothetical protein
MRIVWDVVQNHLPALKLFVDDRIRAGGGQR